MMRPTASNVTSSLFPSGEQSSFVAGCVELVRISFQPRPAGFPANADARALASISAVLLMSALTAGYGRRRS